FGDRRPDRGGFVVAREGRGVESPRQEIAAHDDPLAHGLAGTAKSRGERATQQRARRASLEPARRLHESRAGGRPHLPDRGPDRLAPAKDQRVARGEVVGAGLLERAEIAPLEKHAMAEDQRVPGGAVEIVDRVREGEAEARGAMPLAMAFAGSGKTRSEAAGRSCHTPMV